MENLTHLLPGDPISAMVPSAMTGGNQAVSNARAMTAPGGPPSTAFTTLAGEVSEHPPPDIAAQDYDTPVIVTGSGAQVHASNEDHSDPYQAGDGGGWQRKPSIKLGQWNNC